MGHISSHATTIFTLHQPKNVITFLQFFKKSLSSLFIHKVLDIIYYIFMVLIHLMRHLDKKNVKYDITREFDDKLKFNLVKI